MSLPDDTERDIQLALTRASARLLPQHVEVLQEVVDAARSANEEQLEEMQKVLAPIVDSDHSLL